MSMLKQRQSEKPKELKGSRLADADIEMKEKRNHPHCYDALICRRKSLKNNEHYFVECSIMFVVKRMCIGCIYDALY